MSGSLLGKRPTHFDYACMSLVAYRDFDANDIKGDTISAAIEKDTKLPTEKIRLSIDAWESLRFNGWEALEQCRKPSGMICSVFFHAERQQLVFAYRGTQPSNIKSIKADVFNVMQNKAGDINDDAAEVARRYAKSDFFTKYPFLQVSMTGHSLGAWEAELVCFNFRLEYQLQKRSLPKCYYKCWAVSFESPGSRALMEDRAAPIGNDFQKKVFSSLDVVIYMNKPNFINTYNRHCSPFIYQLLGESIAAPKSTIALHDMVTIYSGMVESFGAGQQKNLKRVTLWPYRPWQTSSQDLSEASEINLQELSAQSLVYSEAEVFSVSDFPGPLQKFLSNRESANLSDTSILLKKLLLHEDGHEFELDEGTTLEDIKDAFFHEIELPKICKELEIDPKDAIEFSSSREQAVAKNIVERAYANFRYIGEVNNLDVPHGIGMAFFFDDSKYTGTWDRGQFSSFGVFISGDPALPFEYRGQFYKGKFHGYGMLRRIQASKNITDLSSIDDFTETPVEADKQAHSQHRHSDLKQDAFIGQFDEGMFCAAVDAQAQGLSVLRQATLNAAKVLRTCDDVATRYKQTAILRRSRTYQSSKTRLDWLKTHFGGPATSTGGFLKSIIGGSSANKADSAGVTLQTVNIIPLLERCACACHLAQMSIGQQQEYLKSSYANKFSQPEIRFSQSKTSTTSDICFLTEKFDASSGGFRRVFLIFTPTISSNVSIDISSQFIEDALSRLPSHYIQAWIDRGYQIIVTGHSIGGILSRMMCANILSTTSASVEKLRKCLFCVSFGAPIVADTKTFSQANASVRAKWESWSRTNNHMIVKKNDPVPVLAQFCNPEQIAATYNALAHEGLFGNCDLPKAKPGRSKQSEIASLSYSFDRGVVARMKSLPIAVVSWILEDKLAKTVSWKPITTYVENVTKLPLPALQEMFQNHAISKYATSLIFASQGSNVRRKKKSAPTGLLAETVIEEEETVVTQPTRQQKSGRKRMSGAHDGGSSSSEASSSGSGSSDDDDDDDDNGNDDEPAKELRGSSESGKRSASQRSSSSSPGGKAFKNQVAVPLPLSNDDDLTMEARVKTAYVDVTHDSQAHFCLIGHELELIQAVFALTEPPPAETGFGDELATVPSGSMCLYSREVDDPVQKIWKNEAITDNQVDFTVKLQHSSIMALLNMADTLSLPTHMKGVIDHGNARKDQRVGLSLFVQSLVNTQIVEIQQSHISLPSSISPYHEFFANRISAKEIARSTFQKAVLMRQAALRKAKKVCGIKSDFLQKLIDGQDVSFSDVYPDLAPETGANAEAPAMQQHVSSAKDGQNGPKVAAKRSESASNSDAGSDAGSDADSDDDDDGSSSSDNGSDSDDDDSDDDGSNTSANDADDVGRVDDRARAAKDANSTRNTSNSPPESSKNEADGADGAMASQPTQHEEVVAVQASTVDEPVTPGQPQVTSAPKEERVLSDNAGSDSDMDSDSSNSGSDDDDDDDDDDSDSDGDDDGNSPAEIADGVTRSNARKDISEHAFKEALSQVKEMIAASSHLCSLLDDGLCFLDLPTLLLAWLRISKEEEDPTIKTRHRDLLRTIVMSYFKLGPYSRKSDDDNFALGTRYRLEDTDLPHELLEPLCTLLPDANQVDLPSTSNWDGFQPNYSSLLYGNSKHKFRPLLKPFVFTSIMEDAMENLDSFLDPASLDQAKLFQRTEAASELFNIFFDGDFPFHSKRTVEIFWTTLRTIPASVMWSAASVLVKPFGKKNKKKAKKYGHVAKYLRRHRQYQSATITGFNMKLAVLHRLLPKSLTVERPSSMSDIEKGILRLFPNVQSLDLIRSQLNPGEGAPLAQAALKEFADNLAELKMSATLNPHAFESVCRWIFGVVSVRNPLFELHNTYPIIGVYGAQGGGKSVLLKQLNFDSKSAFGRGNTKAFDAHCIGTTNVLMVDSYGFDEAVSGEEGDEEDGEDYIRTKKGFLSAFLSQLRYVIFTSSGTSQREYSKEEDQSLIQLRQVPCHVLYLITKFDGFLKKYPDDTPEARQRAIQDARDMIASRRARNATALPGKTIETHFYTSLYHTKDKHLRRLLDEAKAELGDDFWTPTDLKKHMRSVLILHCKADVAAATTAMGLDEDADVSDLLEMPVPTLPIYDSST